MSNIYPPAGLKHLVGLSANRAELQSHAWSPNGQSLAVSFSDGKIYLWESMSGRWEKMIDVPAAIQSGIAWSPTNDEIAISDEDGQIYIWQIGSVYPKICIRTEAKRIISICWSDDNQSLNVALIAQNGASEYLALQSWHPGTGNLLDSLCESAWDKAYAAFSPQRRMLGLALEKGVVQAWDLSNLRLIGKFDGPHAMLCGLERSPDGKTLVLGWDNGWINVWPLKSGAAQNTLDSHYGAVFSLSFSASGQLLVSRSLDQRILFWNCADWNVVAELHVPCNPECLVELAFQPFGQHLVVAGKQNQILDIWKIDEEILLHSQQKHAVIIENVEKIDMSSRITINGNGNATTVGNNNRTDVTTNIGNSSRDAALAQLLSELTQAISKMHDNVPAETVEQMENDVESLKREAKSKAPRQDKMRGFIDDLKKAATNLAEIGEPVLKIVMKLIPILIQAAA